MSSSVIKSSEKVPDPTGTFRVAGLPHVIASGLSEQLTRAKISEPSSDRVYPYIHGKFKVTSEVVSCGNNKDCNKPLATGQTSARITVSLEDAGYSAWSETLSGTR